VGDGTGSVKYRRIVDDVRARIASGEYPAGSQIPTKPQMKDRYGVAMGTVERALAALRDAGLVETVHGAGSFVLALPPANGDGQVPEMIAGLSEDVRQLAERVTELERRVSP